MASPAQIRTALLKGMAMAAKKNAQKKRATSIKQPTSGRVIAVYYQTSKQVAPYCHKHFGAEIEVGDGTVDEAISKAVTLVHAALGIDNPVIRPRTILGIAKDGSRASLMDEDQNLPF